MAKGKNERLNPVVLVIIAACCMPFTAVWALSRGEQTNPPCRLFRVGSCGNISLRRYHSGIRRVVLAAEVGNEWRSWRTGGAKVATMAPANHIWSTSCWSRLRKPDS